MSSLVNNNSNNITGNNNPSQVTLPQTFKSKSEKLAYLKKEVAESSRLNPQREIK